MSHQETVSRSGKLQRDKETATLLGRGMLKKKRETRHRRRTRSGGSGETNHQRRPPQLSVRFPRSIGKDEAN